MSPPRSPSPDYNSYVVIGPSLAPLDPRPNEPPLHELYEDNKDWFEKYMQGQRDLAQAKIEERQKEMRKKQFKHVYRSEFKAPKPTK